MGLKIEGSIYFSFLMNTRTCILVPRSDPKTGEKGLVNLDCFLVWLAHYRWMHADTAVVKQTLESWTWLHVVRQFKFIQQAMVLYT